MPIAKRQTKSDSTPPKSEITNSLPECLANKGSVGKGSLPAQVVKELALKGSSCRSAGGKTRRTAPAGVGKGAAGTKTTSLLPAVSNARLEGLRMTLFSCFFSSMSCGSLAARRGPVSPLLAPFQRLRGCPPLLWDLLRQGVPSFLTTSHLCSLPFGHFFPLLLHPRASL